MSDSPRRTAQDVAAVFEQLAPRSTGIEGDELGFIFGDPASAVAGVACLWQVHAASIFACATRGLNLLLCHEGLWLPQQESAWYDAPAPREIFSNRIRRELLEREQMIVYRSHSNWDALRGDGVPDQAVAALGLHGLREVARQRFFSVQQLPEPMTVAALAGNVRRALGTVPTRVFGSPATIIRRFAFLIGGFGENQWHMPQRAHELGADVIIIGEMSEFIVMACLELGVPVIETLHSASEIPGIRQQARLLAERLPGLRVDYVDSGAAIHGCSWIA